MAFCTHGRTVPFRRDGQPVDGGNQETAYRACVACGVHLPDTWGCPNCEFVEDPRIGEPAGLRFIKGQPCIQHTGWRPNPTGKGLRRLTPEVA